MNTEIERAPVFRRKTFTMNSRLTWGEHGLGVGQGIKLRQHMDGLGEELYKLFEANLKTLPRKSHMFSGGVNGGWRQCPNELADKVEMIVKKRHAEYEAQGYSESALWGTPDALKLRDRHTPNG